jgi:hypothetical protein
MTEEVHFDCAGGRGPWAFVGETKKDPTESTRITRARRRTATRLACTIVAIEGMIRFLRTVHGKGYEGMAGEAAIPGRGADGKTVYL